MKTALLFPGQGSQIVGMGKELASQFASAREVFEEVDAALGEKLSAIIFEGPQETLTLTENAQPAIMATSMAALRVLEKEHGFDVKSQAAFVAGHSLGEYSALCAAGALSLTDTARLLRLRGRAMQQAVPKGQGAMAALIGADIDSAMAIIEEVMNEASGSSLQASGSVSLTRNPETRSLPPYVCSIANDNAAGQVVISGSKAAIDRAVEIAKAKGIKRAILLDVSAPFHCALMAPASGAMAEALASANVLAPCVPVVANVTAKAETDPDTLRELLVQQVTGVVRWRESIEYLWDQGVTRCIEIGAGKVLSGLNKRNAPEMDNMNIGTPADLEIFSKVG